MSYTAVCTQCPIVDGKARGGVFDYIADRHEWSIEHTETTGHDAIAYGYISDRGDLAIFNDVPKPAETILTTNPHPEASAAVAEHLRRQAENLEKRMPSPTSIPAYEWKPCADITGPDPEHPTFHRFEGSGEYELDEDAPIQHPVELCKCGAMKTALCHGIHAPRGPITFPPPPAAVAMLVEQEQYNLKLNDPPALSFVTDLNPEMILMQPVGKQLMTVRRREDDSIEIVVQPGVTLDDIIACLGWHLPRITKENRHGHRDTDRSD